LFFEATVAQANYRGASQNPYKQLEDVRIVVELRQRSSRLMVRR